MKLHNYQYDEYFMGSLLSDFQVHAYSRLEQANRRLADKWKCNQWKKPRKAIEGSESSSAVGPKMTAGNGVRRQTMGLAGDIFW